MAKVTGHLKKGLVVGEKRHRAFVLRTLTAGDVVAAQEESERLIQTPDGYQLVSSPAKMGVELLRRQVVQIGEVKGPLEIFQLSLLSATDLEILSAHADKLDQATLTGVTTRGRDDRGGKDDKAVAGSDIPPDSLDAK